MGAVSDNCAMTLPDGEPHHGGWHEVGLDDLAALVSCDLPTDRTGVIAVDGRGGAGKSTLAARLAERLPGSVVVHTDDLAWHEPFFGWGHLYVELLTALRRTGRAHLVPPQWPARDREGAIDIPTGTPVVVVEGNAAAQQPVAHLLDAVVWVQSDFEEAERKGIARDVAQGVNGDPAEVKAFWDEWQTHELPHFAADRPWERADVVVAGTRRPRATAPDDDGSLGSTAWIAHSTSPCSAPPATSAG